MKRALLGVRGVVAVLVVLLAGCQSTSRYENLNLPPQYGSVAEVRDALNRAGLGCQGFQTISPQQRDIGGKDAFEVATCRVDNTAASILIWLTLGEAQDWARSRETIGCQFARSLDASPPIYVDGGRWAVAVDSRMVATNIAEAIGGTARFADCRALD